ncbi:MAG TPA: MarR family transcriptional regulator [Mucilaginibacter sp.]|nr:MarR family transcriptional regulator [Mucilaginibacter sp.]
MEKLKGTVFYSLENAIKSYRQFGQRDINRTGLDITIDQWLVLKTLEDSPGISQQQLAALVFKDVASITRITDLLVKKSYLNRDFHATDRRRFELTITDKGRKIIETLKPIVKNYRSAALNGILDSELELLHRTLKKIIANTQS